jgi:deoxyribose-phosphate aldolase
MCQTIKEYAGETGGIVGIKAAGGISDYKKAMVYWYIVKHILGEEWLNNQRFRIGASSLANNLLSKIIGKECRHF